MDEEKEDPKSSQWGKGKTDPKSWWKKGARSPNPKGRPKGSKNQKTLYKEAFETKITVTMDGKQKTMSKKELGYHQVAQKAANGDIKAFLIQKELDEKSTRRRPLRHRQKSSPRTMRPSMNGSRCARNFKSSRKRTMAMADPFELRRTVDDLCRRDFRSFAIRAFPVLEGDLLELSPHIDIICRLLEKVHDGEVRRALVCIPPRYLKTYLISIAYTAWLLGRNPKTRIVCASYAASLAEKFSGDTLRLMRSPF